MQEVMEIRRRQRSEPSARHAPERGPRTGSQRASAATGKQRKKAYDSSK